MVAKTLQMAVACCHQNNKTTKQQNKTPWTAAHNPKTHKENIKNARILNPQFVSQNWPENAVHQRRRQSDHQLNEMIEAELKSLVNATRKPTIGRGVHCQLSDKRQESGRLFSDNLSIAVPRLCFINHNMMQNISKEAKDQSGV